MNAREETLRHIKKVNQYLIFAAKELLDRATRHDDSKLLSPEVEVFDEFTEKLHGLSYGSPEYTATLEKIKPALEHHYAKNSHHSEHYPNGIDGMDLFDLTELLFDWKAATERHDDGNLIKSLEINKKRYNISDQLYSILRNTVDRHIR